MSAAGGGVTDTEVTVEENEFDRLLGIMQHPTAQEVAQLRTALRLQQETVAELRRENERQRQLILNASVRPDPHIQRDKMLAAVIEAIVNNS
jgi:TolA-binding protein